MLLMRFYVLGVTRVAEWVRLNNNKNEACHLEIITRDLFSLTFNQATAYKNT